MFNCAELFRLSTDTIISRVIIIKSSIDLIINSLLILNLQLNQLIKLLCLKYIPNYMN